ncbi:MAG: hypothetical protein OXU20_20560 [Myxococcales bacterium]|nr:hypothetical protein [Myxococcales bacterium]
MTKTAAMASASLAVLLGAQACAGAVEPKVCEPLEGDFHSEFRLLQGNPGPADCGIGPFLLPFMKRRGLEDRQRNYLDKSLQTETFWMGCAVGLVVEVRTPAGLPIATIRGNLDIINRDRLGGTVRATVFDASGERERCSGSFDAQLMRHKLEPPVTGGAGNGADSGKLSSGPTSG